MRDRRIRGVEALQGAPPPRPRAAGVPRLRLGRDLPHERPGRHRPPGRQGGGAARGGGRVGAPGHDGPRAHALGDPRRRDRVQRAPDRGLRGLGRHRRPQRHHRELRDPAAGAVRGRPRVPLRHRLRGDRPPDRGVLLGRSRRGGAGRLRPPRRPLRLRGRPPRQPGRAGRRAARLPARGRRGRRRDVHGVGDPRLPQLDAQGAVRPRRRDRGRPARGRDLPLGRRRRDRARGGRGRLGRGGGREAGLRDVHAEGDRGAARRDRRDDRRAALPRRAPARRARALRASRSATSRGLSSWPAAPPTTPA